MRHLGLRLATAVLLCSVGYAGAGAQTPDQSDPQAAAEQEDRQKAGEAGEAPPSDEQALPAAGRPRAAGKRQDAREHLARIEEIVQQALDRPATRETPDESVGTAGTPPTTQTGERLLIERAQLEEIRMHLEQIRMALGGQPPPRQP